MEKNSVDHPSKIPLAEGVAVFRPHFSQYQGEEFQQAERQLFHREFQLPYFTGPELPQGDFPLILLSNTQLAPSYWSPQLFQRVSLQIHGNSGHDNIPPDWISRAPFPIVLGNPLRAQAVTDWILEAFLFHFLHRPKFNHWDPLRQWNRPLLKEARVILFGHGHIGSLVANALSRLTPTLQVIDPSPRFAVSTEVSWSKQCPIDGLQNFNVLIFACDLNAQTQGMIQKSFLDQISPSALLINGARGELMVKNDVLGFLEKNPQAKMVTDVWPQEPWPENEKIPPNCFRTPHIAGVYQNLNQKTLAFEKEVTSSYLEFSTSLNLFMKKWSPLILNREIKHA